jgi:hypothetical protein
MQIILMWIVEMAVYPVVELLVLVMGHSIARLLLPLLSFRRIAVQPLGGPSARFNLLGYRRLGRGRVEIEATVAGFIGLFVGLATCIAIALLTRTAA